MYEYICIHTHKERGGPLFSPPKEENPVICHKVLDCAPQYIVFKGTYAGLTFLEKGKHVFKIIYTL